MGCSENSLHVANCNCCLPAREVIDQYEQRAVLFQSEWEAHALSEAKSRLGISYDAFPHDAVLQN
ncbi:MAG UNVERIFIED_CONTAM: hypothetical protein LVR18_48190 [Planctomycetaceae bacterium]